MNNSNLEFRKIPSLKFLYEINENGTIFRNVKSKKQLKIKLDMHHSKCGYYMSMVHNYSVSEKKTKRVMIHQAVAECWLGRRPDGYEVDHIDRDTHNNDYRNLRYVTKSQQMRNRNHQVISAQGTKNLEAARELRKKPVLLSDGKGQIQFSSFSDCARFLSSKYRINFDSARDRLKKHRDKIFDYDVMYLLNAETKHGSSTEQEIVHESDLTGNYKTAFNKGKQQEVEMRVKHSRNGGQYVPKRN